MSEKLKNWAQHEMPIVISYLLRTGVIAAAIITLTGGIIYLVHSGQSQVNYSNFQSNPIKLENIKNIVESAAAGDFNAILQIGIFVLIATPVARVFFSIFAFLLERDYLYVILTLIVFGILISSIIL